MRTQNLWELIFDRISLHKLQTINIVTYNALFEILLGIHPSPHVNKQSAEINQHDPTPIVHTEMLKVISQIVSEAGDNINLRKVFLDHLLLLLENSKENCRAILQQSVWQDWILLLAPLRPQNDVEIRLRRKILDILKVLLYHAVKYEWGGWRVFVDTIAIMHSKVSYENHRHYLNKMYEKYQEYNHDFEQEIRSNATTSPDLGVRSAESATPTQNFEEGKTNVFSDTKNEEEHRPEEDVNSELSPGIEIKAPEKTEDSDHASEDEDEGSPDLGKTLSVHEISKQVSIQSELKTGSENLNQASNQTEDSISQSNLPPNFDPETIMKSQPGAFQIPEFRWSEVHVIVVEELFTSIQRDIDGWNELIIQKINNNHQGKNAKFQEEAALKELADIIDGNDNAEFVNNVVHIVGQISDNIILACGGILPILASSTSINYEIDVIQSSQGLSLKIAWRLLDRLIAMIQTIVFKSSLNLEEIEKEKQMPSGMLLRQILRLTVMTSIRNTVENRYKPTKNSELYNCLVQMCNRSSSIVNDELLLQVHDIQRLRAIIYRDKYNSSEEAQFLALSSVYFLSVLLVSKYRDLLDTESVEKISTQVANWTLNENPENQPDQILTSKNRLNSSGLEDPAPEADEIALSKQEQLKVKSILQSLVSNKTVDKPSQNFGRSILSTVANPHTNSPGRDAETASDSSNSRPNSAGINNFVNSQKSINESQNTAATQARNNRNPVNMGQDLYDSLSVAVGFLTDVLVDFNDYLSSTLIGSHGNTLLTDLNNIDLSSISSNTVVSIVMLLCSQEWQNSIQKNAGLAFIELINEGRMFCHNTKDNIVQVSKTAEAILQRQKQEIVKLHANFQQTCAVEYEQQRTEDNQYDQLVSAAKHRDKLAAEYAGTRAMHLLYKPEGLETNAFWRLDYWEDDTRRRRRLIRNPHGSNHDDAVKLMTSQMSGKENELTKPFMSSMSPRDSLITAKYKNFTTNSDYFEYEDLALMDTDSLSSKDASAAAIANQENLPWSINAELVTPGVCVPGSLTVTSEEFFFDVDETSEVYRKYNKDRVLVYF